MVRWVTTERGLDAADFALVAYGGAGPLHAAMVARELRIAKVVIPRAPGHFSAYGMLVADLRRDFVNTWFNAARRRVVRRPWKRSTPTWSGAAAQAIADSGLALAGVTVQRAADMRYVGQEHAVTVELPVELFRAQDRDGIKQRFDAVHETRYGYSAPDEKAEIVSLRSAVIGLMRKPAFEHIAAGEAEPPAGGVSRHAAGLFRRSRPARRYADLSTARRCSAGNRIAGPALIEEHASTTVVHPGDVLDGRCLRRPA